MQKLNSLTALKNSGLSVLKYKVLSENEFIQEIRLFLEENNLEKFMVRTDGKGKFSPSINNAVLGFEVRENIRDFLKKDFTVFIMGPGNIYRNFHSINIVTSETKAVIEVVGPGFIATDLNRHGYLHESYEVNRKNNQILKKFGVSKNKYRQDRKEKISNFTVEDLKKNNSHLLEYENYVPLTSKEKEFILSSLTKLDKAKDRLENPHAKNLITSLSFIDLGRRYNQPIFWDSYCIS